MTAFAIFGIIAAVITVLIVAGLLLVTLPDLPRYLHILKM